LKKIYYYEITKLIGMANPPDDTNSLNSIVNYVHVVLTILSITLSIIVAILAYFMNNCSNTINAPAIVQEINIGIDLEILLTFAVAITFGLVGIFAIGIKGVFQGLNPFIMGVLLPTAIICSHKRMKIQGTKLAGNIADIFHYIKSIILVRKSTPVHPQQQLIEVNI
jgi:hypothetical protein